MKHTLSYKRATTGRRSIGLAEIGAHRRVRTCHTPGQGPLDSIEVQSDVPTGIPGKPPPYIDVRGAEVIESRSVVVEGSRIRFHGDRADDFPRYPWSEIRCFPSGAPGPQGVTGAFWVEPDASLTPLDPGWTGLVGFVGPRVLGVRHP